MDKKVKIGIICCNYTNLAGREDYALLPFDVIEKRVACGGFITTVDIIKMFEEGASGVLVAVCKECHNKEGNIRGAKKADEAAEVLKGMPGFGGRVEKVFVPRQSTNEFIEAVLRFYDKLKEMEERQ